MVLTCLFRYAYREKLLWTNAVTHVGVRRLVMTPHAHEWGVSNTSIIDLVKKKPANN